LARHGGQLSAPNLIHRTGLAKASVARGLESLVASGIVATAGTGRSVLYHLASDHPLSAVMSALFEAEERRFQSILDSIRSAAHAAGGGRGQVALWLYGSVARGDDHAGSDLDLVLVAEPDALPQLASALRDALTIPAERMGFTPSLVAVDTSDVLRLAAQQDPWWTAVSTDAFPLIGARPDDLAATIRRAAAGKAVL